MVMLTRIFALSPVMPPPPKLAAMAYGLKPKAPSVPPPGEENDQPIDRPRPKPLSIRGRPPLHSGFGEAAHGIWPVKMDGNTRGGGHSEALKNYNLGKTLGHGTFGKVMIAEHKLTGQKVAIKILNRHQMEIMEMVEKAKREIKILRLFIDLIHPHIIRVYEVIETPKDIFVVMEYCQNGELLDYIVEKGRLQEDEARRIFQQIISGVEYCHRNMVVHRDLKPENLLLDSKYNVKLVDFGLSNVMHDGHFLKTSCGSLNYAAPEVFTYLYYLTHYPHTSSHTSSAVIALTRISAQLISGNLYAGPEVDVWSCGVILYALLCGRVPFEDDNIPNLIKKIKGGFYILPSYLSDLAMDLIPRILIVDPMKRITIRGIRDHPWFQNRLPRYLAVPPPNTPQQAKMIDKDTLQDIVNLGYDKDHVGGSLCNRLQNEATVAYYLLLDNRFRATSGYLGADYQQPMERSFNQITLSESARPSTKNYLLGSNDSQGSGLRPYYPVQRKWALGLQSPAQPRDIMIEVLKALQELNVRWKKNGDHNMKCRWCPGFPQVSDMLDANRSFVDGSTIMDIGDANGRLPTAIKFEIQLYKTKDDKYLLDMQRVTGPQLLFLEFCAAFLTNLRVL
ncbi:serine/threonine protein kinase OSK4 isoform X1 [Aegilops tauschii subsp. strangulata]|uniref:serine/threonine protein kinase OSK4 isoform X1 n=1 Tax=Aegilops tauschii subsp. strangulata TaxID=200361 RepID=UPI00098A687C|nr:serine/threonine protein kinase OSK4 isoform X1 [Aegilops tauschii subsp. strangulata]XP_044354168.1 serine/threonine protein kinase OSK4-like isoform X1 [Triticum aestivum]